MQLFQGCTRLQSLDLSYCSRLARSGECQALWTLPQTLKELSLCGVQLEDEQVFVEGMQRLQSLTSLRLCGVSALNDTTLRQVKHGPLSPLCSVSPPQSRQVKHGPLSHLCGVSAPSDMTLRVRQVEHNPLSHFCGVLLLIEATLRQVKHDPPSHLCDVSVLSDMTLRQVVHSPLSPLRCVRAQ